MNEVVTRSKRDPSIELLRCVLMFGIVFEHTLSYSASLGGGRSLACVLDSCVDGFMFISGYYGIKFKCSRVMRLLGIAIFYSVLLNAFELLLGNSGMDGRLILKPLKWWYLWAYLVVVFMAPLIEPCFKLEKKWILYLAIPALCVVFGWSWVGSYLGEWMPTPLGFGPLSFFTLFGVYVFARCCNVLRLHRFVTGKVLCVIGAVSVCWAALFGEWRHNSLPMLALALIWFCAFKKIVVHPRFQKFIFGIAPSMLSIYLIHISPIGKSAWRGLEEFALSLTNDYLAAFSTALIVFVVSLGVDLLRRTSLVLIDSKIKLACECVDKGYERMIESLAHFVEDGKKEC